MQVKLADLNKPEDTDAILELTQAYALDPMGGGAALPEKSRKNLIPAMQAHPGVRVFLAREGEKAIGIASCFIGFSTFKAAPVMNIHDLAVLPEYRSKGVGAALLAAVEDYARERSFAKLTLEVRNDNRAMNLYKRSGFGDWGGGDAPCYFWEKVLS